MRGDWGGIGLSSQVRPTEGRAVFTLDPVARFRRARAVRGSNLATLRTKVMLFRRLYPSGRDVAQPATSSAETWVGVGALPLDVVGPTLMDHTMFGTGPQDFLSSKRRARRSRSSKNTGIRSTAAAPA